MKAKIPIAVIAFGFFIILAGHLTAQRVVEHERYEAAVDGERKVATLARAYAERLSQIVTRIDTALRHLRDEYEAAPADFSLKVQRQAFLYEGLAFQVVVADAEGHPVHTDGPATTAPDLSDRSYFQALRNADADRLYVSEPMTDRVAGRISIQFARPLREPDGGFAGIVLLSVAPETLAADEDPAEVGAFGSVMLVGMDGVVRALTTPQPAAAPSLGNRVPGQPFLDPAQPESGVYHSREDPGGIGRLTAYRRLDGVPLVAVVALAEAELMAPLAEQEAFVADIEMAVSAVVGASILLVAWLAHRQSWHKRRLALAQSMLAHTEERWRLALESVGDGVWDWDGAKDGVFLSARWKAMLGYADDELPNHRESWTHSIHPDDKAAVENAVRRHDSGDSEVFVHEYRMRCKDGAYRWFLDRGVVVARSPAGEPIRAIGILTDISERKRVEETLRRQTAELERSNTELEAFAYVASHDLRQPLRTINSFLGLLEMDLKGSLDAEGEEYIRFVRDAAQRMDRLIVDLLDYSRVGRGSRPFGWRDADALVTAAIQNLETAVAEADAVVEVKSPLPAVWGDESELLRLFQNLIGNAVKYRDGSRRCHVIIAAADDPGGWRFTVRDNGIGIAPEHAERVFGLFQRLHTRDSYEGTGIGLALCKKIVERHGGHIWIEPEADAGCAFHIVLPGAAGERA